MRTKEAKEVYYDAPPYIRGWGQITLQLMLLPAVVLVFVMSYMPMSGIVLAFKDYNIFKGVAASPWASNHCLEHFLDFFSTESCVRVIGNTVIIALLKLVFSTIPPVILAILLNEVKGTTMNLVTSMAGNPDIHHIFPEAYCSSRYEKSKWNSIINKTPILYESNRAIGGHAPSIYSKKIMRDAGIDTTELAARLESHFVDYDYFITDDFINYFVARAKKLLLLIENAMGKQVADRSSEQTIKAYGCSLASE